MDLGDIRLEWQLEVDGTSIDQGTLESLDVAPGTSETIVIQINKPENQPGQEIHLTLFTPLNKTAFGPKRDMRWDGINSDYLNGKLNRRGIHYILINSRNLLCPYPNNAWGFLRKI